MSLLTPQQIISPDEERDKNGESPPPAEPSPKAKRRRWLLLGFRLGCTIVLLTVLLKSMPWSTVVQNLLHLDDGELLIGVIIGLVGIVISAYQWQSLLDGERISIDLRRIVNLYLIGIAFNHFLPTGMGGDVIKAYYAGKEGGNVIGATSAVIMSRITGFVGMLFVALLALCVWPQQFTPNLSLAFLLSCLAMCAALTGIFFGVILLPKLLKAQWMKNRFILSALTLGNTIHSSLRRPKTIGNAIVFGILFHLSAALNYYAYARLLHIQAPLAFYLLAIPFVSLIAFLPISINGYGLRENAFVFIFSTIHVPMATSVLLVLIMDVQGILFGIIGGAIYFLNGERKKRFTAYAET